MHEVQANRSTEESKVTQGGEHLLHVDLQHARLHFVREVRIVILCDPLENLGACLVDTRKIALVSYVLGITVNLCVSVEANQIAPFRCEALAAYLGNDAQLLTVTHHRVTLARAGLAVRKQGAVVACAK